VWTAEFQGLCSLPQQERSVEDLEHVRIIQDIAVVLIVDDRVLVYRSQPPDEELKQLLLVRWCGCDHALNSLTCKSAMFPCNSSAIVV
jgi:hypothetical protein